MKILPKKWDYSPDVNLIEHLGIKHQSTHDDVECTGIEWSPNKENPDYADITVEFKTSDDLDVSSNYYWGSLKKCYIPDVVEAYRSTTNDREFEVHLKRLGFRNWQYFLVNQSNPTHDYIRFVGIDNE